MTGEITLRGKVLPVGGIKEKVLAARRIGIKRLIIPAKNDKDVKELPQNITGGMEFVFVEHMDRVLEEALLRKPKVGKTLPKVGELGRPVARAS
jgi:ATP-dependent Lon protease